MPRFKSRFSQGAPRRKNPFCRQRRPALELLEDRTLPAVLTVGPGEQFSTIGAAVSAANPSDTVMVFNNGPANAPYSEQVFLTKSLTLMAAPGNSPIIQLPANPQPLNAVDTDSTAASDDTVAIVNIYGNYGPIAVPVTVTGFVIDGFFAQVPANFAGVYVRDSSMLATITSNIVENIRQDPLPTAPRHTGYGILIGQNSQNASGQPIMTSGTATIDGNTIYQYQQDGINVYGSAFINQNTILGLGSLSQLTQNGIDAEGALVITNNVIRFNEHEVSNNANADPFDPGTSQAGGIYLHDTGAGLLSFENNPVISGNVLDANDFGIDAVFTPGFVFSAAGVIRSRIGMLLVNNNQLGYAAPNRFEGIIADQGITDLTNNTIYGGNIGILVASFHRSTDDSTTTLTGNVVALANFGIRLVNDYTGTSYNPLAIIGDGTDPGNLLANNDIAGLEVDSGAANVNGLVSTNNGVGAWVTGGTLSKLTFSQIRGNFGDNVRVTGGLVPSITDSDLSLVGSKAINNETAAFILAPDNFFFPFGTSDLSAAAAASAAALVASLVSGPVDSGGFLLTAPLLTPNPNSIVGATGVQPDRNQLFITQAYLDLLGRTPSAQDTFGMLSQLLAGQNTTTQAATIVGGAEFSNREIQLLYFQYLGALPTADQYVAGQGIFASSGTFDAVRISILSSDAYFTHSGGANSSFLSQLYQDVLNRPIDSQAQAIYSTALANGSMTRMQVVQLVVQSGEAQQRKVVVYYQQFLRRTPTAAELEQQTEFLLNGGSEQTLIANLVGTTEYFANLL